jgi:general secretion pathway protein D
LSPVWSFPPPPALPVLRFISLLTFVGGVALAQNVPIMPQLPGLPPAMTNSEVLAGTMTRLQFPNTDVKEVLSFYERLTKSRLVIDNQVQGTVNIVVAGEVPVEEAIRIIEINLLLNGFTLVPVERSNIVKVVGAGKNPRTAAIPIISDELLLPNGEQVVTFLVKLQYADPVELQNTLTAFISPAPGGYTNLTALPKSQALLITENTATIRGVLRVLREIDVPPAEVVSEFIPLEQADANDVLEKLEAIFEKQASPAGAPAGRVVARPPVVTPQGMPLPPGTTAALTAPGSLEIRGGALSEDSIIMGRIKLTADVRTNRIHVVTRPINMAFVRKLIQEFDSTVIFGEPVSRPLRYIPVGEVLDVVVKSITEPGMKEEAAGGARSALGGGSTASRGTAGSGSSTGFGSGDGGAGGAGGGEFSVSEGLATEPVDTTPEARIIGTTKIIADKNANAIIVIGSADVKAKVFRLLDKLDQRIPQVMLHTIIGELNLDQREKFGVDYIIRSSGLGISPIVLGGSGTTTTTGNDGTGTGAGTAGSGNDGTTTAGRSATDLVGFNGAQPVVNLGSLLNQNSVKQLAVAGGSGLSGFVTAGNSLTAIVTALENTNRFRVVSRPSVFTKNNKKAIIASGQEIAVPTSIQSSVSSGNNSNGLVTASSVQFKRIALQLEVVPLINSEREVSLDILQKVDEVSGTTRIDNNDIPNIATRYVKTSVTVPNEGTLVLGGLIKQSQSRGRSGIPLLSNIPVLGYLFSTTSKEKLRTELVILIRPVVSWSPPESNQIRERAQEFLNMEPDLESTLYPKGLRPKNAPVPLDHPRSLSLPAKQSVPVLRK